MRLSAVTQYQVGWLLTKGIIRGERGLQMLRKQWHFTGWLHTGFMKWGFAL